MPTAPTTRLRSIFRGLATNGKDPRSQVKQEAKLSSLLADSDLQELKSMKISNGDSWIYFRVRSVARYRGTIASCGIDCRASDPSSLQYFFVRHTSVLFLKCPPPAPP